MAAVFCAARTCHRGFVGIDWKALIDAIAQGGDDVMSKIEGGNPGLGAAIVFAMLMAGASITLGCPALSGVPGAHTAMVVVGPAFWRP